MLHSKAQYSLLTLSADETLQTLNAEIQIFTLFRAELMINPSCSVEMIDHRDSLHYPVLSNTFIDDQPFGVTRLSHRHCKNAILQKSHKSRFGITIFSCYLVLIWTKWWKNHMSVTWALHVNIRTYSFYIFTLKGCLFPQIKMSTKQKFCSIHVWFQHVITKSI